MCWTWGWFFPISVIDVYSVVARILWCIGGKCQSKTQYVKHSVEISETVAAFDTYALHVHLHFCAEWKDHYSAMLWIHSVVFACLYDPFVYSGMATGTEGAGCFVFAPFNMQPWRSYYCAVMITFEWKATSSGREKKKEPQAGLIFFLI